MMMPNKNTHKGRFKPSNPSKYKGDVSNIIYRSSWELRFLRYLDQHPDVIEYASEEFFIPYESPIDGKIHRYFPDFWVKKRNKDGTINTVVVEIKPQKEVLPPPRQDKMTKRYLQEVQTYGVNQSKWKAAESFCKERDWQFLILTEKELYGKK